MKNCVYCQGTEELDSEYGKLDFEISGRTRITYFDDLWGWSSDYVEINYFPMCGRKLEETII